MRKIDDNMYVPSSSYDKEWMHDNDIIGWLNAEQYERFKIWDAEESERRRIKEKKENRENNIIAAVVIVVIILLIWGLLAAIAEGSGVGISGVLFAIFFFPAILAAAKGC